MRYIYYRNTCITCFFHKPSIRRYNYSLFFIFILPDYTVVKKQLIEYNPEIFNNC